jgi:hypothetical protein
MNKVKKFISNNKEEFKVLAYGTIMMIGGIYVGNKYANVKWNNMLLKVGDTGEELHKLVGNEIYTLYVDKEKLK